MRSVKLFALGIVTVVFLSSTFIGCGTSPGAAPPPTVDEEPPEPYGGGAAFWSFEMIREETGHSYRPLYDALDWNAAEAEARAQGGYLFVPNDQAEHDWVVETFREDEEFFWAGRYGSVHIGLSDQVQEGLWSDVDRGDAVMFTAWAPEEPNNCDGCEHYAELNLESADWNDLPDDVLLPAIIEFDADPFETGLSAELGYRDQYYGVRISLSLGDGQHTAVIADGWSARRAVPLRNDFTLAYLYFQVDDDHYYDGEGPVEIRATYFDTGYGEIFLEYDSLDDAYKGVEFVAAREYSNKWKTKSVRIDDARLANRQNLMSDFRFSTHEDPLILARVEVRFPE